MEKVHTRGYTALNQPATRRIRVAARVIDLSLALALLLLAPIPSAWVWIIVVPAIFLLFVGQQILFGRTAGQWIWRLRRQSSVTFQKERLGGLELTGATFATALAVIAAGWTSVETVWRHPVLMPASQREIIPLLQGELKPEEWEILPFFYTLGAWPKSFDGHPVIYSMPYMKGPPARFVGRVVARWEMPDTKVTIEGPKTPTRQDAPERLKECFTTGLTLECAGVRAANLMRHVREIRGEFSPTEWGLQWFEVKNPAIPADEQPRGILLSAGNQERAQDRLILVNSDGVQQTLILDRPSSTLSGTRARTTLETILRSMRLAKSLDLGRAWADRALSQVNLEQLSTGMSGPGKLAGIARIQSLLISKVSVEPASFDAYYHLGGTSLLLTRELAKAAKSSDPASHELAVQWTAASKPLIRNALRFAKDIRSSDPRLKQMESYAVEAKEY